MDEFEDLKDYEKLYKINKNGELWSCRHKKVLSLRINSSGYISYMLCNENVRINSLAHRLVGIQFIPNPDNLPLIDHIDRNILNNNVENLRWVNHSQNQLNTKNTKHPYIYWSEEKKCYRIDIRIKDKRIYNSSHKELDKAILMRDAALILLNKSIII